MKINVNQVFKHPDPNNKDVIYGISSGYVNVNRYRLDCFARGGILNECGSKCPQVCVFICELE